MTGQGWLGPWNPWSAQQAIGQERVLGFLVNSWLQSFSELQSMPCICMKNIYHCLTAELPKLNKGLLSINWPKINQWRTNKKMINTTGLVEEQSCFSSGHSKGQLAKRFDLRGTWCIKVHLQLPAHKPWQTNIMKCRPRNCNTSNF